jgi:alpha-glucosidase
MHTSVCPPPSESLADADWIEPGRATWSWYSSNTGNVELQKQYADWASELGFEFNLVDWNWEDFFTEEEPYRERDPWDVLKELVDYSLERGVKTWVWQNSSKLKDTNARRRYFENIVGAGVVGVKIDFFDTESMETIDYMTAILEETANYKIMLNFHGTPKATGLSRTYPHEMCREADRGSEWHTRRWGGGRELTPAHNVISVFTRDVIGNNDYTPVVFDPEHLQGFTRTHQLAQAVCYTSPVTHWCDQPHFYIESSVRDIIMSIPTLWEETLVLEPSRPGKLAALARYDGTRWFIGIMNGEKTGKLVRLDLGFLGDETYDAELIADDPQGDPLAFERIQLPGLTGTVELPVNLNPAGGFVARFTPSR